MIQTRDRRCSWMLLRLQAHDATNNENNDSCEDDSVKASSENSRSHSGRSNSASPRSPAPPTTKMTTTTTLSGIEITECDFPGAGMPRSDLAPEDIPTLLMEALQYNDYPHVNSGLDSMWMFAGDTTRFIFQQNRTDFIQSALETAEKFPTSFYGNAIQNNNNKNKHDNSNSNISGNYDLESSSSTTSSTTTPPSSMTTTTTTAASGSHHRGRRWSMETELNRVGGETGWIATQVMKTISSDGRIRRWQWELRKHKRPPNLNCWYVESIGSSDRKGNFEAE